MLGWWNSLAIGPAVGGARVSQITMLPPCWQNPPTTSTLVLPPTYVTSTPRFVRPCRAPTDTQSLASIHWSCMSVN